MSLIIKTIEAFPKGRTTKELFAILDVEFKANSREKIRAELLALQQQGLLVLGRDQKWRAVTRMQASGSRPQRKQSETPLWQPTEMLMASPALFTKEVDVSAATDDDPDASESVDSSSLLRYYRAALQSDPRGALTQAEDRHGTAYQLLSGNGDSMPDLGETGVIKIGLDGLPDAFREALTRRETKEKTLAIGWPISVTKKSGAPAIQPVGLIAATWKREASFLYVRIETNFILINPDWIKSFSRRSAWSLAGLSDVFLGNAGSGLQRDEFILRLREAAAQSVRGKITGRSFAASIDPSDEGIFDALAIFLPTETSFTAGAVRNLDEIGSWDKSKLSRTALGPLLGLEYTGEVRSSAPINVGPLNHEQINAAVNAMNYPLSVVTGPPGTGKSQAIVAIAASEMLEGGSVIVASKNHQALDAVEERLTAIAQKIPFSVRTLNPSKEINQGMIEIVEKLVQEPSGSMQSVDGVALQCLKSIASERLAVLEKIENRRMLHLRLANTAEAIEVRKSQPVGKTKQSQTIHKPGLVKRLVNWVLGRGRALSEITPRSSIRDLEASLSEDRKMLQEIGDPGDPVAITTEIEKLTQSVLGSLLSRRAVLSEEQRLSLSSEHDDLALHGGEVMSRGIAETVLEHRPLWLASVLGTPKRIPLYEGLFDLVIFDEASQCDIASALPLLARARRAVIVGDDRQLAFISQIGIKQDRNLMVANGLPGRGTGRFSQGRKSLFDLARSTPDVPAIMLRDQYRSAEDIVGYINEAYYGGKLRVSANLNAMKLPKGRKPGLAWTHVPGPATASNNTQNINLNEVRAVVAEVKKLILEDDYEGSLGVIAPFRTQVQELEKSLRAEIPESKWKSAELRVGTVDGFQGQERDVILFSPTVHASIKSTAVTFIQRDWRRLNVAISRARAVVHIFGDLDYARSGAIGQLRSLAARATEPRSSVGESVFDSEWERIVFHALRLRGLDPKPQHPILGRRLDFALFGVGGIKLDLEVDGRKWHQDTDGNRKIDDHWRDHLMRSAGWRVRRFWVDELKQDMEGCLDLVERDLSN